jgi:hypothetical protein
MLVSNAAINNTCVDRLIDWLIEETGDTHWPETIIATLKHCWKSSQTPNFKQINK